MNASRWAGMAVLWAVGAAGCAQEQEALIVLYSVSAEVEEDEATGLETCVYSADNAALERGVLDVSAGDPYLLAPILRNNLPPRASSTTNSGVDDSELRLEGTVDLTLHIMGGVAIGLPLSYTAFVATDSLGPGEEHPASFDAIPKDYAEAFAEVMAPGDEVQVSVDVLFHASRTGNSRGDLGVVDARLYSFPITLCHGCMVLACTCDDVEGQCVAGSERQHIKQCGNAQDRERSQHYCERPVVVPGSSGGDPTTGGTAAGDTMAWNTTGAGTVSGGGSTGGSTTGISTGGSSG